MLNTVLAVAVIGIAMPLLAALYFAHRQSTDSEIEIANSMSSELLRRSDEAGRQGINAWKRLHSAVAPLDCSDASIALLREIDMAASYLQVVGLVDEGHIQCSSLGRHDPAIALGTIDYVSTLDTQVRISVNLGFTQEKNFLVLQKDNVVAAIDPQQLTDVFVDRKDVALGVVGRSSAIRMSSRGFFDPRWIARLGDAPAKVFFNGEYLVSIRRSDHFDMVAYVAVPEANLRARMTSIARIVLPFALLLAAALSFGIVKLARQRASLPAELRAALKRREFEVHYQPIVELGSRRIVGVEALLRWSRRKGPVVAPDIFIPVAERCGLIPQFTHYVLQRLAEEMPRLSREFPDCYVSINLASSDLHADNLVDALRTLVETSGISASKLIVEATEHSFLDLERAQHVLAGIRALGIRIAIDDFGTGYSNLSQLVTLQTDFLKIDKLFVETVGTDSPTSQVALHIIHIAESLGLTIIGEGVETERQAAFLHEHGVPFGQGWLFHKAMGMETLLTTLRSKSVDRALTS